MRELNDLDDLDALVEIGEKDKLQEEIKVYHSGTQSLEEGERLWEREVHHFQDLCTVPCTFRVP